MAHAEPPSRSRISYPVRHPPAAEAAPEPLPHRHRTTRALWSHSAAQDIVLVLLTYLVIINFQFVLGRGEYRDAEAARIEQQQTERIRVAICELLDGLPAGPLFDPQRAEYECGPGVPVEELQPEALAQLREFSEPAPVVTRAPGRADQSYDRRAPREDPAEAAAAPATSMPTPPPSTTAATPTPDPAPPQDAPPLTDTVCDLIGVCL